MAAKYRWKITRDRIDDGESKGVEGPLYTTPTDTEWLMRGAPFDKLRDQIQGPYVACVFRH